MCTIKDVILGLKIFEIQIGASRKQKASHRPTVEVGINGETVEPKSYHLFSF